MKTTRQPSSKPSPGKHTTARPTKVKRARGAAPEDEGLFAERMRRIVGSSADAAVRTHAVALCTFDEWTDPNELRSARKADTKLADQIVAFTQVLIHRTLERAAFALAGREFEPARDDKATKALAADVEAAFRGALRRAFPSPAGSERFPVRAFEKAFAAFVGGEIRTGRLVSIPQDHVLAFHGIPDGANHFCFAEAVLLFLRLDLCPDFWRPLLRTFIGGAQFFAALHWDRTTRSWNAYKPRAEQLVAPGAAVLAAVDHLYGGMDHSRLARTFGEIVAMSLRDEPRLPRPVPTAKEFQ